MKIKTDKDINDFNIQLARLTNINKSNGRNQINLSPNINDELRRIILQDKSYSNTLTQLAKLTQASYNKTNDRPDSVKISNSLFKYKKNISTDEYSHYENEHTIIISVHGADTNEKTIFAIKGFVKPNQKTELYNPILNKYREVLKLKKQIFLLGHSLGAPAITFALKSLGGNGLSCVFAPYVNRIDDDISKFMASNGNIKKIFFDTDWLSTTILKMNPVNLIVYKNFDPYPMNRMSGHYIYRFVKNPPSRLLPLNPTRREKVIIELERLLFRK